MKDTAVIEKPWSNRNNLLNVFQQKIEKQTHGRLSRLELEFTEAGVAVFANSDCYYDMQLVLHAIQQFSKEYPQGAPTLLELNVNGHAISLNNQHIDEGFEINNPTTTAVGVKSSRIRVPTNHYRIHPSEPTPLPAAMS